MRDASPEIYQWDEAAGQTACTAQLLYMHGKMGLGKKDFVELDQMIGRPSGFEDKTYGNLGLILQLHFKVQEISPMDPALLIGPNGQDYMKHLMLNQGMTEAEVDAKLAETYALMLERTLRKQGLTKTYGSNYAHVAATPTEAVLASMIAGGSQVGCTVVQQSEPPRHVLILGPSGPGRVRLFDPAAAREDRISIVDRGVLMRTLAPVLLGYHQPVNF